MFVTTSQRLHLASELERVERQERRILFALAGLVAVLLAAFWLLIR